MATDLEKEALRAERNAALNIATDSTIERDVAVDVAVNSTLERDMALGRAQSRGRRA